ncbi:hypothetical protein SAMN05444972_103195 [Marininema halotolerans]|uniref:Uncharacterized protein n=1 Tax=Marininema halotolerans TaxID=1155944 RepID=A0A1I6QJT7_9BACL|nr:hypothetical protein SAMN05444972_103195 [Marininema halotolerans]
MRKAILWILFSVVILSVVGFSFYANAPTDNHKKDSYTEIKK